MLDYRVLAREQPQVEWSGHCAWVDLSGRTRGRVWADADTFEILRFDEHLVGPVDIPRPRERRAYGPRSFTFEPSRYLNSLQARDVRESGRNSHATGADREYDHRQELRRSSAAHHTDLRQLPPVRHRFADRSGSLFGAFTLRDPLHPRSRALCLLKARQRRIPEAEWRPGPFWPDGPRSFASST